MMVPAGLLLGNTKSCGAYVKCEIRRSLKGTVFRTPPSHYRSYLDTPGHPNSAQATRSTRWEHACMSLGLRCTQVCHGAGTIHWQPRKMPRMWGRCAGRAFCLPAPERAHTVLVRTSLVLPRAWPWPWPPTRGHHVHVAIARNCACQLTQLLVHWPTCTNSPVH